MSKIAITCGDPAGVGPEIIYDWWMNHEEEREGVVIIGPKKWLDKFERANSNQLFEVGNKDFNLLPGVPTEEGAGVALEALEIAKQGCYGGIYQGVVTGPVSKEWMHKVGFHYPGQTEYFAQGCGQVPVMGFVGERMVVTLATSHIPLSEVPNKLSREVLYRTLSETHKLLELLGKKNPRIGMCGLNPHAGENGLFGNEEKWINLFLEEISGEFSGVLRTSIPGDTAFYRHLMGEFDGIVALYHDQGLAPLKTVEFNTAVNITLGMPFVRTSPDHGTGFEIAGKSKANSKSLNNAIALARNLSKRWHEKSYITNIAKSL